MSNICQPDTCFFPPFSFLGCAFMDVVIEMFTNVCSQGVVCLCAISFAWIYSTQNTENFSESNHFVERRNLTILPEQQFRLSSVYFSLTMWGQGDASLLVWISKRTSISPWFYNLYWAKKKKVPFNHRPRLIPLPELLTTDVSFLQWFSVITKGTMSKRLEIKSFQ